MELTPALQALLAQHAQQRAGQASRAGSISAANSGLLSSAAPSAPASPPKSDGPQHSAFPGFAASHSLPLEVQAYLQQQQEQQQAAAAVAAVAAAAAHEQQAALGWAPGSSASTQSTDSYSGDGAPQAWPAGGSAYQSAIYGWGGQPLSVEAQQAAADVPVSHGTLPQALFSLQLPQCLQLQALLAQRQQQQFQQQPYGCGAAFGAPALPQVSARARQAALCALGTRRRAGAALQPACQSYPALPRGTPARPLHALTRLCCSPPSAAMQASNYALRRAAQAPQDPPETLLGPHGRYQPYCKQVRGGPGMPGAQLPPADEPTTSQR